MIWVEGIKIWAKRGGLKELALCSDLRHEEIFLEWRSPYVPRDAIVSVAAKSFRLGDRGEIVEAVILVPVCKWDEDEYAWFAAKPQGWEFPFMIKTQPLRSAEPQPQAIISTDVSP